MMHIYRIIFLLVTHLFLLVSSKTIPSWQKKNALFVEKIKLHQQEVDKKY